MRQNHRIRMTYKPFGRNEKTVTTEPYAVKLSRKRWYVICHSEKHDKEFIYALDRIKEVEETNETFKMKKGYSAEKDFEGYIGITAFEDIPIKEVRLKTPATSATTSKRSPSIPRKRSSTSSAALATAAKSSRHSHCARRYMPLQQTLRKFRPGKPARR